MNLALSYNVKHSTPSRSLNSQQEAEFDSPETILAIKKALETSGHTVIEIEADKEAYSNFQKNKDKIDLVFNIAEGLHGQIREAQIPATLETLGIPYTHSGALSHAISLDKALTKKVLSYHRIETPNFQLITNPDTPLLSHLRFPLIIKPNAEGSSKGIFNENLVFGNDKLKERVTWLLKNFGQSVIIEEYLSGREFTVAILGNRPPQVLPIIEQRYDIFPENMPHFTSYEAKWLFEDQLPDPHDAYYCPAPLDKKLKEKVEKISLAAWHALDIKDVARIDMRLNNAGNPSILEVNTLPGMIPDPDVVTYLPIAARAAGISFDRLVNIIVEEAARRYELQISPPNRPETKQKHLHLLKSK